MWISEIFYSLQGEGELLGVPTVFVRTSGCNLRCIWCDTPYTSWRAEGYHMEIEEIVREVHEYSCEYVVLTGGEPMLAREIHQLARELKRHRHHITIETAATIPPDGIACDLASLSPKLSNSTPHGDEKWQKLHEQRRYQPRVIRSWLAHSPYQLKFVVSHPDDIREVESVVGEIGEIPRNRVFLMPEGTTIETLHENSRWLVPVCQEKGFRYAHRLHIELFGNRRGS